LSPVFTPLDVLRFGPPQPSAIRETRRAAWTTADLRAALAAAAEAPAEERRGAAEAFLRLASDELVDGLRAEIAAWWPAGAASLNAAEKIDLFGALGAAQLDVLPGLLAAPPLRPGETRESQVSAARVRLVEAISPRPAILEAAVDIVFAVPDDEARLAFARRFLRLVGRSLACDLTGGRRAVVAPRDAEEALAAAKARLKLEGPAVVERLEAPLREALIAELRARGVALR
jgi:PAS domain-containing protein